MKEFEKQADIMVVLDALLATLKTTKSNNMRGPLLLDAFTKYPHLMAHFNAIYTQPDLQHRCDVPLGLINKVLTKLKHPPIEPGVVDNPDIDDAGFALEIYLFNMPGGNAAADVFYNGRKFGTLHMLIGETMKKGLADLKSKGVYVQDSSVKVDIPF